MPPHSTYRLAHEVSHFLLAEQTRRKRLGLPHTTLNDIVNDWLLEHAKHLGYEVQSQPQENKRAATR